MILSDYLKDVAKPDSWNVKNEQEVEVLMLSASKCQLPSCIFIDNSKFISSIPETVVMVMTTPELESEIVNKNRGVIVSDQPRLLFFALHNYLSTKQEYCRERFETVIDPTAKVSPMACISEYNVTIGKNTIIEPFVMIYPDSVIGDNCVIRAGTAIGGCGFEFKREQERIMSVEHSGGVRIGDFVEIQNNTCIDRAIYPWDDTVISDYCKIDNLVYIAHAVKIDRNVMIVATSGVGGRTIIGENSWVGLGAKVRNGIQLGKNSRANMGAVVTKNVSDHETVSGNFAIEHSLFLENMKKTNNREV